MKHWTIRHNEVGKAEHGWLHAKHYFSFGSYYNPARMGFGKLRVINDDIVEAERGFGTHPHQNMEIITIPLSGVVSHQDSEGNKGRITRGEVQVMSAGRGILHSEFNREKEPLNLFQIWIEPNRSGVAPRYEQKNFEYHNNRNQWTQLVSPITQPNEDGLKIHQDAYINATVLTSGEQLSYNLKNADHGLFILVASGEIEVLGQTLKSRDSLAVEKQKEFTFLATKDSDFIILEVPLT